MTQADKARQFRALHAGPGAFIIPNPWDAGTARLLAGMRFPALATTSAGHAFAAGRPDGAMRAIEVMAHVAAIVSATDLPESADLENGFGDAPETVADTLRQVAAAGAVGGSIEDARDDGTIYDLSEAKDRIVAGVEAVRALSFPFTLTGRAENFLHGQPDLPDTIRRLQTYQEAGADVLYAPGLSRREDIAAVVSAVDRPVNVLMGLAGNSLTL